MKYLNDTGKVGNAIIYDTAITQLKYFKPTLTYLFTGEIITVRYELFTGELHTGRYKPFTYELLDHLQVNY